VVIAVTTIIAEMEASLNFCKRIEDQAGVFLKQLAAKPELVLLIGVTDYRESTKPNFSLQ